MMRSALGLCLLLLSGVPARAEEASKPVANPIYGGAIEFLYAQPAKSSNKRYSDLRDTDFDGASHRSTECTLRGRLDAGDGAGLDGRMFGEFTYLESDAKRSYPTGNLHLQHHYTGMNLGVGGTWMITPMFAPYAEASILLPFKNEVKLSSGTGSATYTSDFDDGSNVLSSGFYYGTAIGVDIRVYESWLVVLHYDFWKMGSGKAGGLHVGVGYAL